MCRQREIIICLVSSTLSSKREHNRTRDYNFHNFFSVFFKVVDLGEELICLGHAVSCQDEGSGLREDHDEPRSLQKLLVRNIKSHFFCKFLLFHQTNDVSLLVCRMT